MHGTKVILTENDLRRVVGDYLRFPEFSFDVETYGTRDSRDLPGRKGKVKDSPPLDPCTNEVFWISLAGPGRADVLPLGHPTGPPQLDRERSFEILEPLFFSKRRKIGHNVKFDLLSIAKYYDGICPPPPYGDTQTLIHLLNENWMKKGGFNLENMAKQYLGYTYKEKLGAKVLKASFDRVARYSWLDAKMSWMLWWKLQPLLESKPKLWKIFEEIEMPVLEALLSMHQHGVYVNRQGFWELLDEFEIRVQKAEQRVYELSEGKLTNIRSHPQRAEYFYRELGIKCDFFTEKGAESVNAEALAKMSKKNPVAKSLKEYGDVNRILTTYLQGYIPHIEADDRIRASYNQSLPVTGRYSCSGPNVQNIPVREKENFDAKIIRFNFVAPPGHVLVVADYTQIELMVLADYTREPAFLKAYREGLDLHRLTASRVYGIPEEEVGPEQRARCKNANFNLGFRGGPAKLAKLTGVPLNEAKVLHRAWHDTYPGVKKWWYRQLSFCQEHGYVENKLGRKRRLPEIVSRNEALRVEAENQAVNFPIQSTAAEIAKIATSRIHRTLLDLPAHLVMQVHDEFMVETPEELADEVVELVRVAMEDIVLDGKPILCVPLKAEIHYGKNWVDAK